MRTVALKVDSKGGIGLVSGDLFARAGEENATLLTVDVSEWAATLDADVTYSIIFKRSDEAAYPALADATPIDGLLSVSLDDVATAESGALEVQLWAEKTGFLEKSDRYKMYVSATIDPGEAPTGAASWLETLSRDTAAMLNATVSKGTAQTATLNADGTLSEIIYKDGNGVTIRTDVFTYTDKTVVEVGTLSSGFTETITYHLETGNVEIE